MLGLKLLVRAVCGIKLLGHVASSKQALKGRRWQHALLGQALEEEAATCPSRAA